MKTVKTPNYIVTNKAIVAGISFERETDNIKKGST